MSKGAATTVPVCHPEPVETAAGRLSSDGKSLSLPVGWTRTTLGKVTPQPRPKVKPQDFPALQYVGMEHIEAHTTRLLGSVPATAMKSATGHFWSGDVLYGRLRPYLNKVHCADSEGLCSSEFIVLPKGEKHDPKFLLYRLNSTDFVSFASSLNAGDRPRVDFDQISEFPVLLPPLLVQRRIVAEIEKQFTRLEAGVAALRRVQADLHRYRAAVLNAACEGRLVPFEATGWRDATFGEVCRVQGGFAFKSTDYQHSGVPLIRIASLVDGEVALDEKTAYLPASYVDEYASFALKKGDVVIAMSGATTGKMATFNLDTPALLNQRVGRFQIKPGNLCNARFMALIVEQIKQQVIRDAYGAAQPNISPKQIEGMPFRLPPLGEQERIVAEVERRLSVVEELSALVESNLKRADRLRQSILQRAFEGKLAGKEN